MSDARSTVNALFADGIRDIGMLGIQVVELDATRVVASVPLAGNENHLGSIYAGALFGVAEVLGGALFFPSLSLEEYYPTVKELTISYRKPAMSDVRAEAHLPPETLERLLREVAATGKSEFVLEASLTDVDGVEVATTRGVYQFRSISPVV